MHSTRLRKPQLPRIDDLFSAGEFRFPCTSLSIFSKLLEVTLSDLTNSFIYFRFCLPLFVYFHSEVMIIQRFHMFVSMTLQSRGTATSINNIITAIIISLSLC